MERFGAWLGEFGLKVVLVGHNVRNFDMKHFWSFVKILSLKYLFEPILASFADTLPLFRNVFPEKISHSQENLYRQIVCSTYNAHNALDYIFYKNATLEELLFFHTVIP